MITIIFKFDLPSVMSGIHPWIHRSNLRIYLRPDNTIYPGQRMTPPPEPVEIDAEGQEQWEVEKILNDKIYRRKRMFLIKWKGFPEYEATWEPLEGLQGATQMLRDYWIETYNTPIPFALPDSGETRSAWTLQEPEYDILSPELDPEGFWQPIQDSDYSETEDPDHTLETIEESHQEL